VTNLMLAAVMQAALMGAAETSYAEAYKQAEAGKPLVVLIGTDWCPGCVTMKNRVMPQVEKNGTLAKVAFTQLNTDKERELATQMMRGNSIPQLVIYHKTADGWMRQVMVGAKSAAEVERAINQAVEEIRVAKQQAADKVVVK
jgi:thioredoxin-like negative regulator of GroEL